MNVRPLRRGRVYLVGAGPGAADLITLRGYRALQAADVILYDNLIDFSVLDGIEGEQIYVGKRAGQHSVPQERTSDMLARHAMAGKTVVRLKGGDPMVLGRGGEEAIHLARLGIPVTMVPGVSNCIAAPELAGIPVTHRGIADSFMVVSAHRRGDELDFSLPPFHPRTTLVILMGVGSLSTWRQQLLEQDWPQETPVGFVTDAGRPEQSVITTTLGRAVEDSEGLKTPTTAIVGQVVSLRPEMMGESEDTGAAIA
jgi:uroporphyrin-III C-methyltransferase / precorrin-2 dehydrogenase / sirohydrochlorin ferrochelatase